MKKAELNKRRKKRYQKMIRASATDGKLTFSGSCEITAAGNVDGQENAPSRFSMLLYSGGKMNPGGWKKKEPIVLDIAGMEVPESQVIPAHRDHNTSQIVGHTDKITKGNTLSVSGVISADNSHATEVVNSSKKGFPWQSSLGASLLTPPEFVRPGESKTLNGRSIEGPFYWAKRSRLSEASFVSLGADSKTSAVAAGEERSMDKEFKDWLEAQGFNADDLSDAQLKAMKAIYEGVKANIYEDASEDEQPPIAANKESKKEEEDLDTITAEVARLKRIQSVREKLADHPDLAIKALEQGWSEEKIELEKLRASYSTPALHVKSSEGAQDPQVVECAMFSSYFGDESQQTKAFGEKTVEKTRDLQARGHIPRVISLRYLMYEAIRAAGNGAGISPHGVVDNSYIEAALRSDQQLSIRAASGFSTVSMSGTLSNLANKTLLQMFNSVPATFRTFSAIRPHNDFKTHSKYRSYGMQDLEELAPTGEIQHTTLGEATYTNQVKTYARMIALTRTMMVNDDLGAFLQIPTMFGDVSGRSLEKSVYTELLENAGGFFSATPTGYNANLFTGAGSALSTTSLETAKIAFAQQVDENGNPIMVQPGIVLTGEKNAETAENLLNRTTVRVNGDPASTTQLRVDDQFRGRFQPVSSPWLDLAAGLTGSSDTVWFLLARPGAHAVMEVAFLNGRQTPTIESSDVDFNRLGMQWRCYFDWGVNKYEPRYGVKNAGA